MTGGMFQYTILHTKTDSFSRFNAENYLLASVAFVSLAVRLSPDESVCPELPLGEYSFSTAVVCRCSCIHPAELSGEPVTETVSPIAREPGRQGLIIHARAARQPTA